MRYETELEVDVPRLRLLELFLDQNNLALWMPGLIRLEPISGVPGEVGAKTRQILKQGKSEQAVVETISVMRPPDEVSGIYEAGSVWNLIENRFFDLPNDKTRWILVSDFRSTNLFMKLLTVVTPGMFKKQTLAYMNEFKSFAEASRAPTAELKS